MTDTLPPIKAEDWAGYQADQFKRRTDDDLAAQQAAEDFRARSDADLAALSAPQPAAPALPAAPVDDPAAEAAAFRQRADATLAAALKTPAPGGVASSATGGGVAPDEIDEAFGDLGPEVVKNMRGIRQRESGHNPRAHKNDAIEDSRGGFQVNARAHPHLAAKYDLFDPVQNAQAAREVYDAQGYGAWYNASKQMGLLDGNSGQPAHDDDDLSERLTMGVDGVVPGGSIRHGFRDPDYRAQLGEDHDGVDIEAPPGLPVRSPVRGRVTFAGNDDSGLNGGLGVVVRTDDGRDVSFWHLGGLGVNVGDEVDAGSSVGVSGQSGNARYPHTHVQVRDATGAYQDPAALLAGGFANPGQFRAAGAGSGPPLPGDGLPLDAPWDKPGATYTEQDRLATATGTARDYDEAQRRAREGAGGPDLPGLFPQTNLGGARMAPLFPGKPTQWDEDQRKLYEKLLRGETPSLEEHLKVAVGGFVRQALNQNQTTPAAAEMPGVKLGASEDDVGRAWAGVEAKAPGTLLDDARGVYRAIEGVGDLAIGGVKAAAEGIGEAAQAVGEVVKPKTRRFYHGTGSAFDAPDGTKFHRDGLFGPGYYLTSDPRVADGYAQARPARVPDIFSDDGRFLARDPSELQATIADTRRRLETGDYGPGTPSVVKRTLEENLANYESAAARPGLWSRYSGPNIRAIDVPEDLNLLDTEANVPADLVRRIARAAPDSHLAEMVPRWEESGALAADDFRGELLWRYLSDDMGTRRANQLLAEFGYDGIAYRGGKRVPVMDADGKPIEHDVTVIFPESLPKITNAISGTPMGAFAGFEQDDEGNLVFSPEKAALGVVAGKLAPQLKQFHNVPGWRQFVDRTRNVIASQGKPGKQLAEMIHEWREQAEQMAGDWTHRMPTVRVLNPKEFDNFVDVAEAKATAVNQRVAAAAAEWAAVRDEIYQSAKAENIDIHYRPDYFPHSWEPGAFEKDATKHVDHLIRTGQAADEAEAWFLLNKARSVSRNRRHGNLEVERVVDLEGYRRDKETLLTYVSSAAKRIAERRMFGEKDEEALKLVDRIARQGGDADTVRSLYNIAVGASDQGDLQQKVSLLLRQYNTVTRLGLAALTNTSQSVNTATVVGALRTAMNAPKAAWSKQEREWALQIGVTLDSVIKDVREGTGFADKALGVITAPGFGAVEKFNRTLAAISGRDFARHQAEQLVAGDGSARRALEALGLDPKDVRAQKGILTPEQEATAARTLVERTQFKVDPQDLPGWASSPWGKVVTQFKTFAYNQTAFVGREIIGEAAKGNVAPLVRYVVLGTIAGAATTEARGAIQGTPREDDPTHRALQYASAAGGVGLVSDFYKSNFPPGWEKRPTDRQIIRAVGSVLGPTVGNTMDLTSGALEAAKGTMDNSDRDRTLQLKRWVLRQLPVFGSALQNRVLPYTGDEETTPNGRDARGGGTRDTRTGGTRGR